MKLIICSVYDGAAEAYMRPWVAQTPGQATRTFADEIRNPESVMNKHPEDFSLWQLGVFFDHDGSIAADHKLLARAHEVLALEKNKANGKEQ